MNTTCKGKTGEDAAAVYLEKAGYRIVERNFRTYRGEVDIVALQDDCLVFIEVKTWETLHSENLELAVGPRKRATIIRTARIFLSSRPEYEDSRVRFDIILMRNGRGMVRHLADAFTETANRW